jgi:very-short-patch-repair endonuclease
MKEKTMLRDKASELRKNLTDAEKLLWSRLRYTQLGHRFRRQVPLDFYIADFVCLEKKLIVELDGGQHNTPEGIEEDRRRTQWLESQGFRVLRFWNHEVMESLDTVLEVIFKALEGTPKS